MRRRPDSPASAAARSRDPEGGSAVMSARIPEPVRAAVEQLREAVDQEHLPYSVRDRLARSIRRQLVPRRKPGPKGSRLDGAYQDYQAGMRGLPLYRKHIRGHDHMSLWRRAFKERRLLNALQKRTSRENSRRQRSRSADSRRRFGECDGNPR